MNSIKCSQCGLTNWSTEESCKRCGAALTDSFGPQQFTTEKPSGSPLKKVILILFLVAIVAIPLWIWQRRQGKNHELTVAIQSSAVFTKPVTVEASKTAGVIGSLSPEAVTLREAGLLTIDQEPREIKSPAINPITGLPSPFVDLTPAKTRLTPKGGDDTQDWLTFEDPNGRKSGWLVPVGSRELIELTSVEGTDTDTARVSFTWNWKPNHVGRNFDFELVKDSDPHGRPRSNPKLSSTFPYGGTAELVKTGNGWEVKSIKWYLEMPDRVY